MISLDYSGFGVDLLSARATRAARLPGAHQIDASPDAHALRILATFCSHFAPRTKSTDEML